MKHQKVTIISPSFNQVEFIEQTIDSVLSQNYPNLEYIIIDGGSKDGSIDIIRRFEKHLTYWVSEPDHGQSHAINKGLKVATGDIVNWLNTDDYYQPNAIHAIAEILSDPAVLVASGRSKIMQDGMVKSVSKGTDVYHDNLPKTIGWARIDQPGTFFKKKVFNEIGEINEQFNFVMDKEFWVRYLLNYGLNGIVKTGDILVNFRLHDFSKTQSQLNRFVLETNSLFMELAKYFHLDEEVAFMTNYLPLAEKKVFSPIHNHAIQNEQARSAIHYFLLMRADELYYSYKFAEALKILHFVDESLLKKSEKQLFRKLVFRTKYIPKQLIQLVRR